jgi:hypothetical protein
MWSPQKFQKITYPAIIKKRKNQPALLLTLTGDFQKIKQPIL